MSFMLDTLSEEATGLICFKAEKSFEEWFFTHKSVIV